MERTSQTGQTFMVHSSVFAGVGGTEMILKFAIDISDRKEAEEARRASERRLQSIIDNSTTAIYLKDLEGRYLLVNQQFETLFGVSKKDVIGKITMIWFRKNTPTGCVRTI